MRKLQGIPHDRVWGTSRTGPWFPEPVGRRVGEVWFDVPASCPLLVKFLFTSEDLSIQVHPPDRGGERGKTEMWHVLRAEDGARVGVGLKREVGRAGLKEACLDGSVYDLLNWQPARPGDTFFIPAGTVHALGAGLVVCEIQQNSDCTFRMFDYGRGRELHLDAGLDVSHTGPCEGHAAMPVECRYFRVGFDDDTERERFAVGIAGERAGECWSLDQGEPAGALFKSKNEAILVAAKSE